MHRIFFLIFILENQFINVFIYRFILFSYLKTSRVPTGTFGGVDKIW